MRNLPVPQELYRHFKGKTYQIRCIAKHSETGEELVIYQAMYGDFDIYARPLSMFMEEVDHKKYPEVTQKYRFEKIEKAVESTSDEQAAVKVVSGETDVQQKAVDAAPAIKEFTSVASEAVSIETDSNEIAADASEGFVDPKVIEFLDARTYEEKLGVLYSMREILTDDMINIMAAAEEIEVKPGSIEDRYEEFKSCLITMKHFECDRLH